MSSHQMPNAQGVRRTQIRVFWILPLVLAAPLGAADPTEGLVPRFLLPPSPLEFRQPVRPGRFYDTMARRAGLLGAEGEGFEAWVYPLKLLDDCRIRAAIRGSDERVDLASRVETVTVRPESVTLTATHSQFTVRQIAFTPIDQPGSVILLDIDTARPLTLTVSFVPALRPMWPAGLGGQYAAWNDQRRVFIISESRRRYNGLVGSPAATRGTSTPAHELAKGAVSFDLEVDPASARRYYYPIVIAGSQTGRDAAYESYDRLLRSIRDEYLRLAEHYRHLREDFLSVQTPDPVLDLALEWAKIALDKGLVQNPDLGTGLVAGWGTSGESARPGFGWFFGGDAFLNQFAISGYGDFDSVRQSFRFLQERQRADGKMMHELSQAAAWVRWFEEYPYGYYHGDTTPLYIVSLHDLLLQSGDVEFLRESWGSAKRAYAYCKNTDEDEDGLMDNTRAGLGAAELGSLLENLHTDILLGALSAAAWRAMASMADLMQDRQTRDEARALFRKAEKSVNAKFWNSEMNSLVHALTVTGAQNRELTVWPAVGVMLGVFEGEHADATVQTIASSALSTDWGTRMLAKTSKAYDPAAYNNGAVWPFLTGLAASAAYARHHAAAGFALLQANARLTTVSALGYHPELLSGDYYRPVETAVPHQLFSSGGIVTPLVRGMLGLRADAPEKTISFAPHLPPDWDSISVRRYRAGGATFDFRCERSPGRRRFVIDSPQAGFKLNLSVPLGLLAQVSAARVHGQPAPFEIVQNGQDLHCLVRTELARRSEIEVLCSDGVEFTVPSPAPSPGDTSRNVRIIRSETADARVRITLEGLAGETYPVRIWTSLELAEVRGGKLASSSPPVLEVAFPAGDPGQFVRSTLELRFGTRGTGR